MGFYINDRVLTEDELKTWKRKKIIDTFFSADK